MRSLMNAHPTIAPVAPSGALTRGVSVFQFSFCLKADGTYVQATKEGKIVRFDQVRTAVDVPCSFYPGMKSLTKVDQVMTENWSNKSFGVVSVEQPVGHPDQVWFQVWGSDSRREHLIGMVLLKAAAHMEARAQELIRNSGQLRQEIIRRAQAQG